MMLSFILAMILNFIPNFAFHYNEGPFTYTQAKAYCKSIGSYMATVVGDGDRVQALEAINHREEAWIGLVHVLVPELTYCYWHYPEESDPNICPVKRDCVNFWVNGSPIKVERGGNECALYYSDVLGGNGGVNNDVDCNTGKPVLCHEDPEICDMESYTCGSKVTWCAESNGGLYGKGCICDLDANGESVCVANNSCSNKPSCNPDNGNGDCATGFVCIRTCCSGDSCSALCGEDVDNTRRIMVDNDKPLCETDAYNDCDDGEI